jgi:hypothetical protein
MVRLSSSLWIKGVIIIDHMREALCCENIIVL